MGADGRPDATITERAVYVADAELAGAAQGLQHEFPELRMLTHGADPAAAAAIITQEARIGADLWEQAPAARLLLKLGRVYDHVDVDAVRARGARFGLVPRKGPNCVAELAMTLILALSKDLVMAHRAVAEGAYRWRGLRPVRTSQWVMAFRWTAPARLHEVRGKVLGCVGFGEIGCELALRAQALGMRVVYTRRHRLPPALEHRYGVEYRDLLHLFDESDYVCLAVPHTADTDRMIGAEHLRRLGPNGYLVNVARGGIVDEDALISALRDGTIAGAGLDVFTYEPLPADSPLCRLDNVILTPHIGGGSGTNRELELREALEEARRALSGAPLTHPVVETLRHPGLRP
jgi:lactate dehydrogenase-like 2-hydroxyacid dehydrogenase